MINDTVKFYQEVYSVVKEIPYGKVLTYGQIARLIGWPNHSRLVGRAMKNIPHELGLACYRVINSEGRLVPGWSEQKFLLQSEGISFRENGCVDLKKHIWEEVII